MNAIDPTAHHPTDGDLRALLDPAAAEPADPAALDAHVAGCAACAARLADIAATAAAVGHALAVLDPPGGAVPDAAAAHARLAARRAAGRPAMLERIYRKVTTTMPPSTLSSRTRRIAAGVAVLGALAAASAFQPVRALASQFLQLFRVQRIQVLQLDPDRLAHLADDGLGEAVGQLFAESVTVDRDPGSPRLVADATAAGDAAGFAVRLPVDGPAPTEIEVHQGPAFSFVIDRARAQSVLDVAVQISGDHGGSGDVAATQVLPPGIDGARVAVDVPTSVIATFGDCPARQPQVEVFGSTVSDGASGTGDVDPAPGSPYADPAFQGDGCVVLMQMPSPTVTAPPGLDVAALAELGLRFIGMSAADARTYSRAVDWTSTLVVPVPSGEVKASEVAVDGVKGALLRQRGAERDGRSGYTILWAKDGRVYALTGFGADAEAGLRLADALP